MALPCARRQARCRTILIGIEVPGVPEVVIELGRVHERCAVRFVSNPSFPAWVTSDAVERELASYVT